MYKIIGSDAQEYGPITPAEMRQWAQQGRVGPTTQVLPEGATEWRSAATIPEFAGMFDAGTGIPKTSGLAIASLVLGILGFCTAGITGLAGIITGAIALSKIGKSQGRQKGNGLAIGGLCTGGASLLFMIPMMAAILLPAFTQAKQQAQRINCINNMKQLGLAVRMYAGSHNDTLPKAENWCDAITSYAGSPTVFICPSHAQDGQRSHYVFNAKLSGKNENFRDPGNTVMIFEGAGGWNASGGPEAAVGIHKSRNIAGKVYIIGFADGSVRNVNEQELARLRWEP